MAGLFAPSSASVPAPAPLDAFAFFDEGDIGDVWGIFGSEEDPWDTIDDAFADFMSDQGLPVEAPPARARPAQTIAELAEAIRVETARMEASAQSVHSARHALPVSAPQRRSKGRRQARALDLFAAVECVEIVAPVPQAPRPDADSGPRFPDPSLFLSPPSLPKRGKAKVQNKAQAPVSPPPLSGAPAVARRSDSEAVARSAPAVQTGALFGDWLGVGDVPVSASPAPLPVAILALPLRVVPSAPMPVVEPAVAPALPILGAGPAEGVALGVAVPVVKPTPLETSSNSALVPSSVPSSPAEALAAPLVAVESEDVDVSQALVVPDVVEAPPLPSLGSPQDQVAAPLQPSRPMPSRSRSALISRTPSVAPSPRAVAPFTQTDADRVDFSAVLPSDVRKTDAISSATAVRPAGWPQKRSQDLPRPQKPSLATASVKLPDPKAAVFVPPPLPSVVHDPDVVDFFSSVDTWWDEDEQ